MGDAMFVNFFAVFRVPPHPPPLVLPEKDKNVPKCERKNIMHPNYGSFHIRKRIVWSLHSSSLFLVVVLHSDHNKGFVILFSMSHQDGLWYK